MKKYIYIISAFLVMSCKTASDTNPIAGKWEVINFEQKGAEDSQNNLPKGGNDIVKSTVYTFSKDSMVTINNSFLDNIKGIYKISNDTLILKYFAHDKNVLEEYYIAEVTSDQLVLTQSFVGMGTLNFFLEKE